jgi:urea transport system permease protein
MLGGLFIAVTLLLPRGIVGTWQWWMARRRASAAATAVSAPQPSPRPAE